MCFRFCFPRPFDRGGLRFGLLFIPCFTLAFASSTNMDTDKDYLTEINLNGREDCNGSLENWPDTFDNCSLLANEANNSMESWWEKINERNMKHSMIFTVALVIANGILFIVGIIGNSVVILVIILKSRMRTVTNLFILNLAVADTLVLVFCLPPTLLASVLNPWILGSFMCRAVSFAQGVSVIASSYTLVAISIDRCCAVCHCIPYAGRFTKREAVWTIIVIWLIAILITSPWVYVFELQTSDLDGNDYRVESWAKLHHGLFYFLFANLFTCYALPLLVITTSCVIIWWNIVHRRFPHQHNSSASSSPTGSNIPQMHGSKAKSVGRMLIIVTVAFLGSWLPLYALATAIKVSHTFSPGSMNYPWVAIALPIVQFWAHCNSGINPVLYAFFNSEFRKMCRSLVPTCLMEITCFPCCGRATGESDVQVRLRDMARDEQRLNRDVIRRHRPTANIYRHITKRQILQQVVMEVKGNTAESRVRSGDNSSNSERSVQV